MDEIVVLSVVNVNREERLEDLERGLLKSEFGDHKVIRKIVNASPGPYRSAVRSRVKELADVYVEDEDPSKWNHYVETLRDFPKTKYVLEHDWDVVCQRDSIPLLLQTMQQLSLVAVSHAAFYFHQLQYYLNHKDKFPGYWGSPTSMERTPKVLLQTSKKLVHLVEIPPGWLRLTDASWWRNFSSLKTSILEESDIYWAKTASQHSGTCAYFIKLPGYLNLVRWGYEPDPNGFIVRYKVEKRRRPFFRGTDEIETWGRQEIIMRKF